MASSRGTFLRRIIRKHVHASYELTDLSHSPWHDEPDGGELARIKMIESVLDWCDEMDHIQTGFYDPKMIAEKVRELMAKASRVKEQV